MLKHHISVFQVGDLEFHTQFTFYQINIIRGDTDVLSALVKIFYGKKLGVGCQADHRMFSKPGLLLRCEKGGRQGGGRGRKNRLQAKIKPNILPVSMVLLIF